MNFYEAAKYMDTGREFKVGEATYKFSCGRLFKEGNDSSWCMVHSIIRNIEEVEFKLIPEKQYTFQEAAEIVRCGGICILNETNSMDSVTMSDKNNQLTFTLGQGGEVGLYMPYLLAMWTEVKNAVD